MKIAYIILAHKNILQIRRLLESIQGENVSIYLHIDRLAGEKFYKEALSSFKGIQNLTFLKRYATNWGGFGLVQATLDGIYQINKRNEADYTILLSGQDYPIKSVNKLNQFLSANFGKSFMENYPFPNPLWKDDGGFLRINKWYCSLPVKKSWFSTRIRNGMIKFMNWLRPQRKFPAGFLPFGGAQWWCLYKDCCEYVETFSKDNKDFVRFFRNVRIPDEIFFHTLLMNSPLKDQIVNQKLTLVDWDGPPYPRILEENDFPEILDSNCFFARKFDTSININILNIVDERILHSELGQ